MPRSRPLISYWMLEAVNIGRSQPWRLRLSSRRSIRRLLLFNCWRILAFTRNPFPAEVREKLLLFRHRRKAWGFRVFHFFWINRPGRSLVQGLARSDAPNASGLAASDGQ